MYMYDILFDFVIPIYNLQYAYVQSVQYVQTNWDYESSSKHEPDESISI